MSKGQEYFELYPKVDTFFETSDGQFFENKGHASYHAKTLDDDTVQTHKRESSEVKSKEASLPTEKNTIEEIKAYLQSKEIDFATAKTKAEFLALIGKE
jgi:hypothetical protein